MKSPLDHTRPRQRDTLRGVSERTGAGRRRRGAARPAVRGLAGGLGSVRRLAQSGEDPGRRGAWDPARGWAPAGKAGRGCDLSPRCQQHATRPRGGGPCPRPKPAEHNCESAAHNGSPAALRGPPRSARILASFSSNGSIPTPALRATRPSGSSIVSGTSPLPSVVDVNCVRTAAAAPHAPGSGPPDSRSGSVRPHQPPRPRQAMEQQLAVRVGVSMLGQYRRVGSGLFPRSRTASAGRPRRPARRATADHAAQQQEAQLGALT
jgi:hypothetical protein